MTCILRDHGSLSGIEGPAAANGGGAAAGAKAAYGEPRPARGAALELLS